MARVADRWQRLSKRQQILGFIGGSLLVVWGVDAAALRPLREQLNRLHQEAHQAEQRLVDAVIASRQAEAVNKAFAAYAPYAKPSGSPESELAGFIGEVESAVHQSGLVVVNLKPVAPHDAPTETLSVAVEGEASPGVLLQFLDLIQRSTHLLKITELTVRVSERQTLRSSMVISKLLLQ